MGLTSMPSAASSQRHHWVTRLLLGAMWDPGWPLCPAPPCLPQVWPCWPRSPRQALPADGIGRGCAVGFLQAVDEGTGQAGLAAVVSPAVLELPGRAGHALRVPAAAIATVLQGDRVGTCGEGLQVVLSVPSLRAKGHCSCGVLRTKLRAATTSAAPR